MGKIRIDRSECISCGLCWTSCPEVFEENEQDSFSQIVERYRQNGNPDLGVVPPGLDDCVQTAAADCPVEIIHTGE